MTKIATCQHRGKLCLRYYVDGRPRYRVVKNENNVESEKIQLAAELMNGNGRPQRPIRTRTLSDLVDKWYHDLLTGAVGKSAQTVRRQVERILEEARITDIKQITAARVRTAINRLRCSPRNPKRTPEEYDFLSADSRHHYARAIRQFCRWLDSEGYAPYPFRKWKLGKVGAARNPRDRLQPDELATMVTTARKSTRVIEGYDGTTRAWLYVLASMTGLRRGELATLTPKSFDWENSTVTVPAAYTKNKETAVLPLPCRLTADLQEWLTVKRGPVFDNLRQKRTRQMIKADLEAAGLPYKTDVGTRCFHSLRNSYISALFDVGCSVATVQRLARHSDVRMTMRYAKPRTDEWEVVNALANPLATQSTTKAKGGADDAHVRKTR